MDGLATKARELAEDAEKLVALDRAIWSMQLRHYAFLWFGGTAIVAGIGAILFALLQGVA